MSHTDIYIATNALKVEVTRTRRLTDEHPEGPSVILTHRL